MLQVAINLVRHCPLLTRLSLLGYEDLSDIVLEFISGELGESGGGLRNLETLRLPDRSYVTEVGVASVLQRLRYLRILVFPGSYQDSFLLAPFSFLLAPCSLLKHLQLDDVIQGTLARSLSWSGSRSSAAASDWRTSARWCHCPAGGSR